MKRIFSLALLAPTAALAHPGGHDGLTLTAVLNHLASQPDHAAMILAALAAGLFLLYRAGARK